MNNENEIERMASIIIKHPLESHASAVELSEQGIGDKKQAVKEFAEKLKRQSITLKDKSGWVQCVVIMAVEIDNLITELYGADE